MDKIFCETYTDVIQLAGYTVDDYVEIGDYQGQWLAVVDNGTRFIVGSYGSCSGCDDLQAWIYDREHEYERGFTKEEAVEFIKMYDIRPISELKDSAEIDPWDDDETEKLKAFKAKWSKEATMKAISLEQLKMYTGQDPEGFYQNLQPCYLQKDVDRVLEKHTYVRYEDDKTYKYVCVENVKQELAKLEGGE